MNVMNIMHWISYHRWFPNKNKAFNIAFNMPVFIIERLKLKQFECKSEFWTYLRLAFHANRSIKLFNNLLANDKSKSDPWCVRDSRSFMHTKEFEQFILIFLWNSNSSILYSYLKVFRVILNDYFYKYFDFSVLCKLNGVWLYVQKNLHYSLLVTNKYWWMFKSLTPWLKFWSDVKKLSCKV